VGVQYAPLRGHAPSQDNIVSRHPSLPHVALSFYHSKVGSERAGVWNSQTGQLLWSVEGLVTMCWRPDGLEALLIRDDRERLSKGQTHVHYSAELVTWPAAKRIGTCALDFPSGWPGALAYSPSGELAACQWIEQDSSGFEFLAIAGEEIKQLGRGYKTQPNLLMGPVFSPDGAYIVSSATEDAWWSGDQEEPSPGGRMRVGKVVIIDTKEFRPREIEIQADVPVGWRPPDELMKNQMITAPVFVEPGVFQIRIPTGQLMTYRCQQ
jgi:hypothetical protein